VWREALACHPERSEGSLRATLYDIERLLNDAPNLAANLRAYINGFSDNMREVLEKFDFNNTISKLDEAGLLFLVMEKFKNIDLHPGKVSNHDMGYIFEELIRKFNEALNENPGEHFTPREVIRLMVNLPLVQDEAALHQQSYRAHRLRPMLRLRWYVDHCQRTHP
jgi:type I restriction enzyme M protein